MTLDDILTLTITVLLLGATVVPYYRKIRRREAAARRRHADLQVAGLHAASTMHPRIDVLSCIGCGTCVRSCPEGDVLAVINGKATLVHGAKCVGHGVCADACPVGAITLVMAAPGRSANLPVLDEYGETTLPNVFIAGELGGMGLIKNAVTQGVRSIERIAGRPRPGEGGVLDVLVVGAGPAGLAAALAAQQQRLRYAVIEQNDIGGTILQYPRRKIVMTSPVNIPLWGRLRLTETTKEALLDAWQKIIRATRPVIMTQEKVVDIQRAKSEYRVVTSKAEYETRHIVLALGRRGTPRKLGVEGEQLSKVTYRLIDAETYSDCDLLVVGGGDSAVEAAVALSMVGSNRVTLSYRGPEFTRIRAKNNSRLHEAVGRKRITLRLASTVREIRSDAVMLQTADGQLEIPNQYVFVFAGGDLPFEFLQRIGIRFQDQAVPDPPVLAT